jgi:competence protein ComEA
MIVLVWNVGAYGRRLFLSDPPSIAVPGENVQGITPSASSAPAPDSAAARETGRLTARQKLLLGRRVDVNSAGTAEISSLPGISDRVAEAVVARRARTGKFRRPEDLLDVGGIKEKRLKKILPFLAGFTNN